MKKRNKIIFGGISIFVFLFVLILNLFGKNSLDVLISNSIWKIQNNFTDGFFIFLGNYSWIILVAIAFVVAVFLYFHKGKTEFFYFVLILAVGEIAKDLMKLIVGRERPLLQLVSETGFSFPSGHSTFAIVLFSTIIYFYKNSIKNKTKKIIFIIANIFAILLIGFSRIYLNVHWFTDVIGGYALGLFIFFLGVFILENKKQRR